MPEFYDSQLRVKTLFRRTLVDRAECPECTEGELISHRERQRIDKGKKGYLHKCTVCSFEAFIDGKEYPHLYKKEIPNEG